LTVGQIERLVGRGSRKGLHNVLRRLVAQGMLDVQISGRTRAYGLNRDHVAAPAAVALAEIRTRLWERMRSLVAGWEIPPLYAAVFGSAARGDGDASSDIDVFLVHDDDVATESWEEQTAELVRHIERWTGNTAQIVELTRSELVAATRRSEVLLDEIRAEGIPLGGRHQLEGLVLDVERLDRGRL
jgi:predicted nucleotidyltransferase